MVLRRALLTGAVVWAAVIPLAAFAATRPGGVPAVYGFALAAYSMGRVICHQLPARSFHLWGAALPVCARCTGIYAGAAALALAVFVARVTPVRAGGSGALPSAGTARRVLIAALVPTALTLVFEWTTGTMPANWIRAFAGFPIGAAAAWLIASAGSEGSDLLDLRT
jgi:uncharacterized membrane protein